jgi:hypothetical protein
MIPSTFDQPHECRFCQDFVFTCDSHLWRSTPETLLPIQQKIEEWRMRQMKRKSARLFNFLTSKTFNSRGRNRVNEIGTCCKIVHLFQALNSTITCPQCVQRRASIATHRFKSAQLISFFPFFHSITRSELRDRASSGCLFCATVVDCLARLKDPLMDLDDPEFALHIQYGGGHRVELSISTLSTVGFHFEFEMQTIPIFTADVIWSPSSSEYISYVQTILLPLSL